MPLRTFETDDAKYYLGLGNHTDSSRPIFEDVDFSTLDMIVFEDSGYLFPYYNKDKQYSEIFNEIMRNSKAKIYGVDVYTGKWAMATELPLPIAGGVLLTRSVIGTIRKRRQLSRRGFLNNGLQGLLGSFLLSPMPMLANCKNTKEDIEVITKLNNVNSNLLPTLILGFRDAVTAKKISQYLIPLNKKEGRKLNVALIYGGMHSGIETKLKNPWISDRTIALYHSLLRCAPTEKLNEVREIVKNKRWNNVVYHDCHLF